MGISAQRLHFGRLAVVQTEMIRALMSVSVTGIEGKRQVQETSSKAKIDGTLYQVVTVATVLF